MKGKKLVLAVFVTLILSRAVGFGMGKLICPAPDPAPLFWNYRGTITEVSREEGHWLLFLTETVTQSEKNIQIPDAARNLGDCSPDELVPGDIVQLLVEFYEYAAEIVCVNYEIVKSP